MIGRAKALVKRHWPALRLRTILFSVLLLVAALPGLGAVFLRVYENTLVRQTEAELVAQGAALAAAAGALWPGAPPPLPSQGGRPDYRPEAPSIDLSSTPVLPERPAALRPVARAFGDAQAEAAAQVLRPIFRATSRTTLASIVLTDARGRVLIGAEAGGAYAGLPEVQAALRGSPTTVLRRNGQYHPRYSFEWLSRASALRIHHARPIYSGGRVVGALLLSRSPRALFRGLYQDRIKMLIGVGAICALLVVLSGLVSRGITRPIEALSQVSRRLAVGEGAAPEAPTTAAIEIRALYRDFGAMAEAIERRSRYLRDFAAAVSHEFKTPLAGIRGAVELLQDHRAEMSEDEQRRFLGNIAGDVARLSLLVSRLLDLARADMAQPAEEARTDLAASVARAADAFRSGALRIEHPLPPDLPAVAIPPDAVEVVLAVLIDNSRHAGAATVTVTAQREGGSVLVEVRDDGPGVAPADRERLFEPFFTSRRDRGGTGLGLSIARSLLAASRATIVLAPDGEGAGFRLTLPISEAAVASGAQRYRPVRRALPSEQSGRRRATRRRAAPGETG